MRNILLCTFIVLSAFCFAQTKSILFIGNSYTYYNGGVDVMLKNIALAEGDTLETEAFTVGGAKFSDFCNNPETFERIRSRAWDYVVLQEQSQLPSFPPSQVETECYPFAKQLCDSIRANDSCTQILFFMTWGRENGDQSNCGNYEPLCTYEGMQQRLRESYVQMADDNNAIVVPVGLAWKYVRDHYPEIDLYQSDESHPTLEGTYLAACTFYSVVFDLGYYYGIYYRPDNIDDETRYKLVSASYNAVNNNWEECNVYESLFLNFEPILTTKTINAEIISVSLPVDADSCVMSSSTGVTLSYTPDYYELEYYGRYKILWVNVGDLFEYENHYVDICATIYRDGCSVTKCEEVYYILGGIDDVQSKNLSFTNPVINGKLQFGSDVVGDYEIYSIDGRLLVSGWVSGCEIDVSQLNNGVYMIRIGGKTEKFVVAN